MRGIEEIKKTALELGACGKINDVSTIKEAINLLQTPQGKEFALKTGFPDIETWRRNMVAANGCPGTYVDNRNVFASNHDIIVVGDAEARVTLNRPDKLYHVIAMHGATVEIHACNYAVVSVTSIDATVRVTNDGTAIVRVEQTEKGGRK